MLELGELSCVDTGVMRVSVFFGLTKSRGVIHE